MKVVITAAAKSPRLLPLTKDTPVSLLEVGGKPIIAHQIEAIQKAGIKDILVITGFCADQVERFCAGKVSCIFNPFYETCNVAMNLWLVRDELKSGFLLQYSDTLFQSELIKEVNDGREGILLVIDKKGIDKEAEKVSVENGLVTAIGKDIDNPYGEFVGMSKFSPGTIPPLMKELDQIARTNMDTRFPQLIERLIGKGSQPIIKITDRQWMDVDFPEDLKEARLTWPLVSETS
ncbi:sugar phosphate nucleotidyltransferase [Chloroflexota bacterium]